MKKFLIVIISLFFCTVSAYALTNKFSINSSKLSFSNSGKKEQILNNFNDDYKLSHSISNKNSKLEKEINELTKKTTYLLLGDFNNTNEDSEEYYQRHKEYLQMGAYQSFPRDKNSKSGYDETVDNYMYASISEFAVPSMFLQFDQVNVIYSHYGDIRVTISNNLVVSSIFLPNVKIREEDTKNQMKYNVVETNLAITYYFIKINNEYKLAYLYGETGEELEGYFNELENTETKTSMQVAPSYDSNLRKLYNFSKLDAWTNNEITNIYNMNKDNILILNSYYNNYLVATANGFFINDGLVITTWNFIEKSLIDAQYITIKDQNGVSYKIDGIVTANPETDIAIIKLKNKTNKKVNLGNSKTLNIEDPVLAISSKTGVGLTTQKGIVVSNDGYIQSTIPLTTTDEGSPLLDKYGNVVGMNTAKQVNTSISLAIASPVLKEVQDKFNSINFDSIETISFEKLKEKFYYVKYNEELINNSISSRKWKEYSKIGNIEETIKLELLKASHENGIVSLRYKNEISDYISSMQLAGSFKDKLIEDGYKEVLSGTKKCIYKNDKYQIVIMDEFNYLIIVMVKL